MRYVIALVQETMCLAYNRISPDYVKTRSANLFVITKLRRNLPHGDTRTTKNTLSVKHRLAQWFTYKWGPPRKRSKHRSVRYRTAPTNDMETLR